MQYGFLAIDHQSVTGIVTALVADHVMGLIGEKVNNFTFAFITPLGAQDNYIFTHVSIAVCG
ncbi:hypothetical protein GCM10023333_00500 [Ferrimonas pelagia]|uniref:Uncharacterized protein n=1 Tax=Ferrimonas pelagia TaxID=1177826 RepID=A0ABP9E8R9_9GAMM